MLFIPRLIICCEFVKWNHLWRFRPWFSSWFWLIGVVSNYSKLEAISLRKMSYRTAKSIPIQKSLNTELCGDSWLCANTYDQISFKQEKRHNSAMIIRNWWYACSHKRQYKNVPKILFLQSIYFYLKIKTNMLRWIKIVYAKAKNMQKTWFSQSRPIFVCIYKTGTKIFRWVKIV